MSLNSSTEVHMWPGVLTVVRNVTYTNTGEHADKMTNREGVRQANRHTNKHIHTQTGKLRHAHTYTDRKPPNSAQTHTTNRQMLCHVTIPKQNLHSLYWTLKGQYINKHNSWSNRNEYLPMLLYLATNWEQYVIVAPNGITFIAGFIKNSHMLQHL
jgi:hypothetical protein